MTMPWWNVRDGALPRTHAWITVRKDGVIVATGTVCCRGIEVDGDERQILNAGSGFDEWQYSKAIEQYEKEQRGIVDVPVGVDHGPDRGGPVVSGSLWARLCRLWASAFAKT